MFVVCVCECVSVFAALCCEIKSIYSYGAEKQSSKWSYLVVSLSVVTSASAAASRRPLVEVGLRTRPSCCLREMCVADRSLSLAEFQPQIRTKDTCWVPKRQSCCGEKELRETATRAVQGRD